MQLLLKYYVKCRLKHTKPAAAKGEYAEESQIACPITAGTVSLHLFVQNPALLIALRPNTIHIGCYRAGEMFSFCFFN